jgi:Zn-dependent M28 family amino/carboxypeptidase
VGYAPEVQEFDFPFFQELSPPVLVGDGCDASDFAGQTFTGQVALIPRGVCNFSVKAALAEAAGAVGVIIYNDEERQEPFISTLGSPDFSVPVVGTSFTIGEQLSGATVHLETDVEFQLRQAANVIAETAGGRDDRVVVVGAHLDSVPEGPGIQDNGSGSAAILEIAIQMAELGIEPRNRVRFAWWGAEEFGLLGSQYYVDNLTKREQKDIALNLNFDMTGSPNFVRFV